MKKIWFWVGGLFILMIIGMLSSGSSDNSSATNAPTPTATATIKQGDNPTPTPSPIASSDTSLDVSVSSNGYGVSVNNNEKSDLTSCHVELNAPNSLFGSGYVYKVDKLVVGEPLSIPYTEFTKDDGLRFDPVTMKPQTVLVNCGWDSKQTLRQADFNLR